MVSFLKCECLNSNMLISLPMYSDKCVLTSSVGNIVHFGNGCLKVIAVAVVYSEKSSLGRKGLFKLRFRSIAAGKSHHIHSQALGEKTEGSHASW